ncbi:MAG: competence/damage-inducible protein A [Bacteroidia bacterium]|nr:competence/damage-inducible protein A [Bacteroidia bacterium]
MQAEIITIGDEILIGQIIDTNSAYISKELNNIGVSVYQITSVQDDKAHILKSLAEAEGNADIVIITGGLGPTKDDITKTTIAEYFDDTLVQDPSVLKNIEDIWKKYIKRPLSQINIDQALMPTKATALMNLYGSAPGMWLEKNNTVFIALPGVPFEMKALVNNEVLPRIRKKFDLPFILHRTLLTFGLGESVIANRLEDYEKDLPDHMKLAYLPNLGKVRLRLSAKGKEKSRIIKEMDQKVEQLIPMIEDVFFGFEEDNTLEELVAKTLTEKGLTLAIAESCSGGRIAEQLTANSGASSYFKGSIVSYATSSKIDILNIDPELIETHSVVSEEIALAMAKNVRTLFHSDYGISTTGNAGPTKGESDAEVGTVFIGIATPEHAYAEEFHFGNHRTKVINKSVHKALEMLQKEISKN